MSTGCARSIDNIVGMITSISDYITGLGRVRITGFSLVVGNPPYQAENGTRPVPIYPHHWHCAELASNAGIVNMITMANWQRTITINTDALNLMRLDSHLIIVDNWLGRHVFNEMNIPRISIQQADMNVDNARNNVRILDEGRHIRTSTASDSSYVNGTNQVLISMLTRWMHENGTGGCDALFKGQRYYPVRASEHQSTSVDNVPCMFSVDGRNVMKAIDFKPSEFNADSVDKYKVIIKDTTRSTGIEPVLLGPGMIYSDQFIGAMFSTENEAIGFISYMRTELFQSVIKSMTYDWHVTRDSMRYMPDLSAIVNMRTGLTGYESDWTDGDLLALFTGND